MITNPTHPSRPQRGLPMLDRAGQIATLALPVFLTHFRGIAEGLIDVIGILWLVRCVNTNDWAWLRQWWMKASLLWWVWLVVCSLPIGQLGSGRGGSLLQALLTIRFVLFAGALSNWTLTTPVMRRRLRMIVCGCVIYIGVQLLVQAVFGYNLFGIPRFHDGTLTGPYREPRAAGPMSRLLLPVMLLGCALVSEKLKSRATAAVASSAIVIGGCAIMILSGQRMPFILMVFGLMVCAIPLRQLRLPLISAIIALPILLLVASVISPQGFDHLVRLFKSQMEHFATSPYGLIYNRSLVMAEANPWTGLGYDAYRHACADHQFFQPGPFGVIADGGGSNPSVCVQHTHNHYLEALTDSGIPGFVLFCIMIASWLVRLARQLDAKSATREQRKTRAWRIGLFAGLFIQEWPIASASAFLNLPLGGWAFLLLGMGLAYTSPYMADTGLLDRRRNPIV